MRCKKKKIAINKIVIIFKCFHSKLNKWCKFAFRIGWNGAKMLVNVIHLIWFGVRGVVYAVLRCFIEFQMSLLTVNNRIQQAFIELCVILNIYTCQLATSYHKIRHQNTQPTSVQTKFYCNLVKFRVQTTYTKTVHIFGN